ncbi:carbohydrate binding family 9 domain-containing protein [Pseudoalteromonas xiamenensis]|uniref:carbohydrate binding family 9 domain-containing protein n=1 Tax=Pseudoalteromonas xiamenensis TaxID=882626 RepID=UPI0027E4C54A|nr:DUF5916 domain-containing protein [Pseudoalteromonas xiamenensis]WMN60290.1 carbohydrate binding family 9 domain-containing protein [Pseudoalteromonas xiamenensis]
MYKSLYYALLMSLPTGVFANQNMPYINAKAKIDGKLDEAHWQNAKKISINNISWPHDNLASPVDTTAYVYEDGESLFIGFEAKDPSPEHIRAFYRDRDQAWNDDLVGLKIDTYNSGRIAYQFFVNPFGVQMDSIENELSKTESSAWNGIWDSVGVIHADGYTVEIEIPFRVLNFDDNADIKTMAMEFVRFYPRNERLRLSSMTLDHANTCWICQMPAYDGFEKAKQGNNIAVIPSFVAGKTETRDIDDGIAEPWESDEFYEPSVDLKWAITPDVTLNATLNPDFSQVEADSGQLNVNNSFSLFYPEQRSFFLENNDYFSSFQNLIHTRNIATPDYGMKVTGSKQGHTFAAFVANDSYLNVLIPGNLGSSVVSLSQKSDNAALRYRYDFNSKLSVGSTSTLRQSDDYENKLVSIDSKFQPTENDTFKAQFMHSQTQYSDDFIDELCDGDTCTPPQDTCVRFEDCDYNESVLRVIDKSISGSAYLLSYDHFTKYWSVFSSYNVRQKGYRADLGFVDQIDFNKFLVGGEMRWYGDEQSWWNRARWYTDWDITHNDDGELLEKEIQTEFVVEGPMQSQISVGIEQRNRTGLRNNAASLVIDGNTQLFSENTLWTYLEFKPLAGVFASINMRTGNRVDLANNRVGDYFYARPNINLNIGQHFEFKLQHIYEKLNADGNEVYTANLSDVRFTYQFDVYSYLRLAIIYTDIQRNQANYIESVDATYKAFTTQLLYSYKLNPQTVFFAGFGDSGFEDDDLGKITKDTRSVFAKFSYAWLL